MKNTLFSIILFTVGFLIVLPAENFFAQETIVNPTGKRNSPYAPNPKKKLDKPKTDPVVETNGGNSSKPEESSVKIEKASLTANSDVLQPVNNQTPEQEKQNVEFESRSVAKKTMDIAKRNSSSVNAPPTEIYKVGSGDVLDIRILNSPSKDSTLFTVLESGSIDYPLAGTEPLQIVGMTAEEIEDLLKERVKLYENPQITVTVRDYASHTISVSGLVEKPGTKALRREAIPLYVILAEAIPQSTATKATIMRGVDKQTITVNLEDNETLVYPNDIIRITGGEIQSQFYFIGGEITSGGQKEFHEGLTLTQAILACGGLKKSSTRKVVIRRKDADGKLVPTEYDLKSIKEGKVADPILKAGDTIEIGS